MPNVGSQYESMRYCKRCGKLEDRNNMRVVTLEIEEEAKYFGLLCPKCIAELKDFYNKKEENEAKIRKENIENG